MAKVEKQVGIFTDNHSKLSSKQGSSGYNYMCIAARIERKARIPRGFSKLDFIRIRIAESETDLEGKPVCRPKNATLMNLIS